LANPSRFDSLEEIVNALLNFARPVVVVVLVGTLMYGGWVYMTAQDNDDKISTARRIIISAVIGFIIIVLAPVILQFVGSLLGVQENLFDV
jgi:hypothetical protein